MCDLAAALRADWFLETGKVVAAAETAPGRGTVDQEQPARPGAEQHERDPERRRKYGFARLSR